MKNNQSETIDTKKLNLGSGKAKREGYINVDINPALRPDLVHNLDNFPYPFKENEFDEIVLDHVVEHLENPLATLEELHRISKNDGKIILKCPHFSCAWLHPGHKSAISTYLFDFFDENHPEKYGQASFEVEKINLFWIRNRKDSLGGRSIFVKVINSAINFFANLDIHIAERVWCYWVGGFEEICFIARVKKN
jgi:SAM-dependent methyltransferase